MLAMPDEEAKNFLVAPGCVQWLVRPDGTLLVPMYFKSRGNERYQSTVLHCRFDGTTMELVEKGDELSLEEGRGLYEPSLALFRGTYYLTLRNDARSYVTTSQDGLHFEPVQPWTFDDGLDLGSYNTQQHWLVHDQGLFLSYTRRGANNDHIARNRAPIFLAQVDPAKRHVIRATEKVLMPERGVMLGNFGAAAITPNESWVTDAEYMAEGKVHPRGANGSVFAARVQWSQLNKNLAASARARVVVLGDSITKGVRSGVTAEETFASLLQSDLRKAGHDVDVINHGIGGERTDQALARLSRDIQSLEPTLVTVMYGTNDSYVDKGQKESRLTKDIYVANLQKIVGELRRTGIQVVLMTEPRWGDKAASNGVGENPNLRLEPFVEGCRQVAHEQHVPLVDHFQVWSKANAQGTDIGEWTTDQCHPNPSGHKVLAETMLPVILPMLDGRVGAR
jgi:lysophospholipase L1-like esterase